MEKGGPGVSKISGGSTVPAEENTRGVAPASVEDITGQELYPAGLSDSN
jgi:hypothetical protein